MSSGRVDLGYLLFFDKGLYCSWYREKKLSHYKDHYEPINVMESHWIKVWEDVAHMTPSLFLLNPRFQKKMCVKDLCVLTKGWDCAEASNVPGFCKRKSHEKLELVHKMWWGGAPSVHVFSKSDCFFWNRFLLSSAQNLLRSMASFSMDLRYNYIYVPWTTDGASNIGLAPLCFDFP